MTHNKINYFGEEQPSADKSPFNLEPKKERNIDVTVDTSDLEKAVESSTKKIITQMEYQIDQFERIQIKATDRQDKAIITQTEALKSVEREIVWLFRAVIIIGLIIISKLAGSW